MYTQQSIITNGFDVAMLGARLHQWPCRHLCTSPELATASGSVAIASHWLVLWMMHAAVRCWISCWINSRQADVSWHQHSLKAQQCYSACTCINMKMRNSRNSTPYVALYKQASTSVHSTCLLLNACYRCMQLLRRFRSAA